MLHEPCCPPPQDVTYGLAVRGLDGLPGPTLRATLDVDLSEEPNVRALGKPVPLHGTVRVSGLTAGASYVLYRYKGLENLPSTTNNVTLAQGFDHGYEHKTPFTAAGETWEFVDPNTFASNGATYYVAIAA